MTDDEIMEALWHASKSGDTIREEWLGEFVRHPEGEARIRALLEEADLPTRSALAELLHEFADAPRRNASKKRRGKEWWRVLAIYLHEQGPETWDAKFAHLPDEHEETLKLGNFEFHRRIGESRSGVKGPLVCCSFDDGREPDEISFSTFERHLKNHKPE